MSRNTKNAVGTTSCAGSTQQHPLAANPIFAGQLPPIALPPAPISEIASEIQAIHNALNEGVSVLEALTDRLLPVSRPYPTGACDYGTELSGPSSPVGMELRGIQNRVVSMTERYRDILNSLAC